MGKSKKKKKVGLQFNESKGKTAIHGFKKIFLWILILFSISIIISYLIA